MTQKIALITGAGRAEGLGIATARALAEQGFHVIVTARTAEQAEAQAAALAGEGHSVEALRLDLADADAFPALAAKIAADHGHLDVLVNNASPFPDMNTDTALEASAADIQAMFDVNIVGPWALTNALRELLVAAPAARVVNLSSGAFWQVAGLAEEAGDVGAPAYSFSKFTVNALTQLLGAAFRDTNVLVNAVDPGRADTHPELGTDEEDVAPAEAAKWIVRAATLPAGSPSGALFADGERIG